MLLSVARESLIDFFAAVPSVAEKVLLFFGGAMLSAAEETLPDFFAAGFVVVGLACSS